MIKYSSELLSLLSSYIRKEKTMDQLCDGIFPYLEMTVYNHARSDWEVSGEVLACIYEVQDGVMQEEKFQAIIQEFLDDPPAMRPRRVITRRRFGTPIRVRRFKGYHTGKQQKANSRIYSPYFATRPSDKASRVSRNGVARRRYATSR